MGSSRFDRDVCVIGGGGHVGLPLALTFADSGLRTVIYDIEPPRSSSRSATARCRSSRRAGRRCSSASLASKKLEVVRHAGAAVRVPVPRADHRHARRRAPQPQLHRHPQGHRQLRRTTCATARS